MIANAIDKILSLATPNTITLNDKVYSDKRVYEIAEEKHAKALELTTLTSLVDYIRNFKENLKPIPYIVHVVSPTEVRLISALDCDRERETVVVVNANLPKIPFGQFLENEQMLITMQSMFLDGEDKALVLKFAGTVTSGSLKEYGDDGITQKATIKSGVASRAEAIVPSPCVLKPYRTFHEVEQPSSSFIFRMREERDSVTSALFEADGGAWKNIAKNNIREYLTEQLEGTGIIVIS